MNVLVATPSQRAVFYLNLLSDPNPGVRRKAAEALGKIGDKGSLVELKAQLEQEIDEPVRLLAKDDGI